MEHRAASAAPAQEHPAEEQPAEEHVAAAPQQTTGTPASEEVTIDLLEMALGRTQVQLWAEWQELTALRKNALALFFLSGLCVFTLA